MVYVQYYEKSAISDNLIDACGDRSVVILDGRNSQDTWHNDAIGFNGHGRPQYKAYRIYKGRTFTDSFPVTPLVNL